MTGTYRRRGAAAAITAALVLLGAATFTAGPADAVTGAAATSDPLAVAQGQLAGCQAWLAQHPGSTSAQHTRMVQCVTDEQAIIAALTAVTPSPSNSPSASPSASPTAGTTTPAPTSASPTPPPTTEPPSPTPSPTAAAWPDATNTGVPAGTVLTPYTGSCTISTPGAQLIRVLISSSKCGQLLITTHDVVIRESEIDAQVSNNENAATSFTLIDSTVKAGTVQAAAVLHTHLTVIRSNISGGQTAVACVEACNVSDSWLHGQIHDPTKADQHFGGFLSNGGGSATAPSVIQHNTIACDVPESTVGGGISSCSGDINLYGDFGGVSYYSFINNLLVAPTDPSQGTPSYCAYGGTGKAGLPDHIVYQDNVFMRGLPGNGGTAHCGWWGAATSFDVNRPGDVWSGNHYQDGEVIPAPGP